jgi:hypothetical protein
LEPASELPFATAFHDPGAGWGRKKNQHAEPVAKRMLQPEDQAGESDSKCNGSAADDKELPEDTHVLERQRLRHDCAELFGLNLASRQCDAVHARPER